MNQDRSDSEILRPTTEISTPEIREGFRTEVSGLSVPSSYNPEKRIVQNDPAQIHLPEQKPTRILTPQEENFSIEEPDKPEERGPSKELIFYQSNPWNYFDKLFQNENLVSPIDEIQQQIKEAKEKLPTLSESSKILLQSPLKHVRETEKQRLISQKIKSQDLEDYFLPDTSFVNVSNLDFIQNLEESDSLENFYKVLEKSIEDLFVSDINLNEQLKHLSKLSEYLIIISEAFMYRSSIFKINNPVLLEKITQEIKSLNIFDSENIQTKYLQNLFDFLSHFEMNNRDASILLLEALASANFHHPLEHELRYQIYPENRIDESQEKVGMEIEAIPLVAFAGFPDGFSLGIDGGGVMPEFRKKDQELHFDNSYKKQLFDLWYWSKMSQLKGASLHIHLDDLDGNKLKIFEDLFGRDIESVDNNQKSVQTVELRFNLSGYTNERRKVYLDLAKPFFHQQYDLVQFIEMLIQIGNKNNIEALNNEIMQLPGFWQTRLTKEKKLTTFNEVLKAIEGPEWNWYSIKLSLDNLESLLNLKQFFEICEKSNWEVTVVETALNELEGLLNVDQFFEVCKKSGWDEYVIKAASNKLEGLLNMDQVFEICKKSDFSTVVVRTVFEKLNGSLSLLEQVLAFCRKFEWDSDATEMIFKKFEDSLNLEQILMACKESEWRSSFIIAAFNKIEGSLSFENVLKAGEKSDWNMHVVEAALNKMEGQLSFEQVLEIYKKSEWRWYVIAKALNKMKDLLNLKQVFKICEKAGWNWSAIKESLNRMEGSLTLDQVLEIGEKSGWDQFILEIAINKLDGHLSFELASKISEKAEWKYRAVKATLDKMKNLLSLEQLLEISKKSMWSQEVVPEALKRLDGSLSLEQTLKILKKSNWNYHVFKEALKKLDDSLSLEQALKICKKSKWSNEVVEIVFDKLEKSNSEETDKNNISKILEKAPASQRLFFWSLFSKNNFKKPIRLDYVFSNNN